MKAKLLLLISVFCALRATAQGDVQWIANASLNIPARTSLYDLTRDDKPVILAVGNVHSQATEALLETGALQKLTREHALPRSLTSIGDLRVTFLNITVFPGDEVAEIFAGMPAFNIPESADALNTESWSGLYSINDTRLFVLTPDHLIFPLPGGTADDLYDAALSHVSRLHPTTAPDVRLLTVRRDGDGDGQAALVSIQNFSTTPLAELRIALRDAEGIELSAKSFVLHLAPLEGATLSLPLEQNTRLNNVQVVAEVANDANPSNNIWTGSLEPAGSSLAAGSLEQR